MATLEFNGFGVGWRDVLARLGGDAMTPSDVARAKATVGVGSTTAAIVVDSTAGFAAGDKVSICTGAFPDEGEAHTIAAVTDATTLDFTGDLWSAAPASGDELTDGPERIEDVLLALEAEVESRLPEPYCSMLRKVAGEVLTRRAMGTETVFTLALSAATAATV